MVVNNTRYLINEESKGADKMCKKILEQYPKDAVVEFDQVKPIDL